MPVLPGRSHYGQGSRVLGFTIEWDDLAIGTLKLENYWIGFY